MNPHLSSTRHLQHSGSTFAATQSASDSIVIVDLSLRPGPVEVGEIVVGRAPWGLTFDSDRDRLFVATAEGVAVVDGVAGGAGALIAVVPFTSSPSTRADAPTFGEYRAGGTGIALSPDGSRVYVGVHRDDERMSVVEVIDTTTLEVVDNLDVGERPFDIQISPSGHEVYSIDHDSFTLHTISARDHAVRSTIVAPFGTEGGHMSHQKLHYAAVADDGTLYMPFQGKGLVAFDADTGEYTTAPMTGDTHQHGTALTDDGRLLVVGVGPIGGATLGPSLTVRDLESGAENVIELDRGHENVIPWIDPATGRRLAILTGGSTSRGPWDGLTLVDLDTSALEFVDDASKPQQVVPIA